MIRRLAAAALAFALVGCGGEAERVIAPEQLQRDVSQALNGINRQHESVSCPEGVTAQIAESTTCTMTADGAKYQLTVVVKSVEGDRAVYDVDVAPQPLPE